MITGLDHVQIAAPAGCEPGARRFYGEQLGMREIPKPDALRARGGVWFRLPDGRELHVGVDEVVAGHPDDPAVVGVPVLLLEDDLKPHGSRPGCRTGR